MRAFFPICPLTRLAVVHSGHEGPSEFRDDVNGAKNSLDISGYFPVGERMVDTRARAWGTTLCAPTTCMVSISIEGTKDIQGRRSPKNRPRRHSQPSETDGPATSEKHKMTREGYGAEKENHKERTHHGPTRNASTSMIGPPCESSRCTLNPGQMVLPQLPIEMSASGIPHGSCFRQLLNVALNVWTSQQQTLCRRLTLLATCLLSVADTLEPAYSFAAPVKG